MGDEVYKLISELSVIKSQRDFLRDALAKATEKYDAASKFLIKLGYKEVMLKHGLDWYYSWERKE